MAITVAGSTITFNDGTIQYSAGPRAWLNITGSTGGVNASIGISSVSRTVTGGYIVSFSSAMPDTNYVMAGSPYNSGGTGYMSLSMGQSGYSTRSTTQTAMVVGLTNSAYDVALVAAIWFR